MKRSQKLTITEDKQLLALADSDLCEKREQVERDTRWVLSHDTALVCTGRVEVAEECTVPYLRVLAILLESCALRVDVVCNDLLVHGLGVAVWVGCADGAVLWDWDHAFEAGGIAVDGGGGGEDDVGDVVAGHGAEEADGTADVDAVVLGWDLGGLSDGLRNALSVIEEVGVFGKGRTFKAAK